MNSYDEHFWAIHQHLEKAAMHVGLDNGLVNRGISRADFLDETRKVLIDRFTADQIRQVDRELEALSPHGLEDLCCGGEPDRAHGSQLCEEMLNEIFEPSQ